MMNFTYLRTAAVVMVMLLGITACSSVPDSDCDVPLSPERSTDVLQAAVVELQDEQQRLETTVAGVVLEQTDAALLQSWSQGELAVAELIISTSVYSAAWEALQLAEAVQLDAISELCAACAITNNAGWLSSVTTLSIQASASELDALYALAAALEQDWLDKADLANAGDGSLQSLIDVSADLTATQLQLVVSLLQDQGVTYTPVTLEIASFNLIMGYS